MKKAYFKNEIFLDAPTTGSVSPNNINLYSEGNGSFVDAELKFYRAKENTGNLDASIFESVGRNKVARISWHLS